MRNIISDNEDALSFHGGGRLFTCRLRGLRLTIPFVAPHMPARITAILPRYHNQLPELNPAFQPLPASSPLFSPIFFFFLLFLPFFLLLFRRGKTLEKRSRGREVELLPAMRDGIANFVFSFLSIPFIIIYCTGNERVEGRRLSLLNLTGFIEFLEEEEFFLLRAV